MTLGSTNSTTPHKLSCRRAFGSRPESPSRSDSASNLVDGVSGMAETGGVTCG